MSVGAGASTATPAVAPAEVRRPEAGDDVRAQRPWIVLVWNDPINLMSYVTWVFQRLFGFPRAKAEKLMWDVHTKGKAVVASGAKAECETHVARLHAFGLWATMQHDV
jgi:ATP-dependent Clp protease adaptor protein ClpS